MKHVVPYEKTYLVSLKSFERPNVFIKKPQQKPLIINLFKPRK